MNFMISNFSEWRILSAKNIADVKKDWKMKKNDTEFLELYKTGRVMNIYTLKITVFPSFLINLYN